MRSTLIIACAIVVFAAGAKAQDALKPCRQIKDDGKRLKCYDSLDRSSSSVRERLGQSRLGGATAWIITDEKSPLDDSPLVSAALPSSDDRSHLLMRCKDRETQVAVSSTGFINCGPNVRHLSHEPRATRGDALAFPSELLSRARPYSNPLHSRACR